MNDNGREQIKPETGKYRAGLIISAALLVLFGIAAPLVLTGALSGFEDAVYNAAARLICPAVTAVMKAVTFAGSYIFIIAACALLLILPWTSRRYGAPLSVISALSALSNHLLKQVFVRARPDSAQWIAGASGYSFPSGHSMAAAALFIGIAVISLLENNTGGRSNVLCPAAERQERKITHYSVPLCYRLRVFAAVVSFIAAFLIGFSRVYLGVHYAGDVIGGWLLGAAFATGGYALWQIAETKIKKEIKKNKEKTI